MEYSLDAGGLIHDQKLVHFMNRRKFIYSVAACGTGFFLPQKLVRSSALQQEDYFESNSFNIKIAGLFSDLEAAKAIGIKYLETYPEKVFRNILLHDIGLEYPGHYRQGRSYLEKKFGLRCKLDFLEGNTVCVDNWILARAEASLCGLVALS